MDQGAALLDEVLGQQGVGERILNGIEAGWRLYTNPGSMIASLTPSEDDGNNNNNDEDGDEESM